MGDGDSTLLLHTASLCSVHPFKEVLCARFHGTWERKCHLIAKGGLLSDAELWDAWQLLLASCPVGSGLWAGETAALAYRAFCTISCLISCSE